jgi:DNA-binding NarL/FixJ family response regulator
VKENGRRKSNRLSPNQSAVLAALAEGFSVKEVAMDWGVSETVVYRNIEAARKKLGALTTPHAVAIWVAGLELNDSAVRRRNGHRVRTS